MLTHAYPLFYGAGFVVAAVVGWWLGRREGFDGRRWAALLAVTAAGGVIGSRVLHFDFVIGAFGDRTFLGGLVGGALVFAAARRRLGIDARGFDIMAVAVPVGHALGRVGCYLAGCCAGAPSSVPWAVAYAPGTAPHQAHVAAGLVPDGAAASLAVHPVQLYDAGVQLVLLVLVLRLAGRFRRPGSAVLFAAGMYAAARVGLESLRFDAWAQPGITTTQWTVALLAAAALGWLVWREHRARRGATPTVVAGRGEAAAAGAASLTALLFLARVEPLTPVEAVVAAGALAAMVPWALTALRPLVSAAATAGAMPALAAVFLVQATADTTDARQPYSSYGFSGTTGSYVESCGGAHRVNAVGASYAHMAPSRLGPHTWATLSVRGFAGSDDGESLAGGGGAVAVDSRWVGAGLGILAGSITLDGDRYNLFPTGHLRLGPRDRLYLEGRVAEHDPVGVPIPGLTLGIGFALNDATLGIGVSPVGFYLTGRAGHGRWSFAPFAAYGDSENYQLGLAVRVRHPADPTGTARTVPARNSW